MHSVLQGSVFGPLLFVLYTADVTSIATMHNVHVQMYANDAQQLLIVQCLLVYCTVSTTSTGGCALTSWNLIPTKCSLFGSVHLYNFSFHRVSCV